ncbi:unnamed protein product [Porites lobata]|uniref:Uncharacterized protein n=1 Tax=Porites lobata TaxID=104759 RepID=A0ABN8NFL9_9CNID|nr:unnamed protein product [Porites lobata]
MNRIPPPRPDETKLPHYRCKDVFESPSGTNACHHPPDDWQPRHNIKKCFDDGTLLASNYIKEEKNMRTKGRLKKRKQRQQKCFEDYDWNTLCRTGKVQQYIKELETYLSHSNPPLKGKKYDKVRRITAHALIRIGEGDTNVSLQRQEVLQDDISDNDMDNCSDAESDS